MKFIEFPGGVKGAVGIAAVVVLTMIVVNRFLPAKVRGFVQGA